MAGCITYNHLDKYPDGDWLPPVKLSESARIKLEKIINRQFTAEEIQLISKHLADIQFLKSGFVDASMQDVKRTLRRLSREQDGVKAYRCSDTTTQAFIEEVLHCDIGLSGYGLLYPTNEQVNIAATIALDRFQGGSGGRPKKIYREELARLVEHLWKRLKLKPSKTWAWNNTASRNVLFMEMLANIIGIHLNRREAVKLLKK